LVGEGRPGGQDLGQVGAVGQLLHQTGGEGGLAGAESPQQIGGVRSFV
jgi:hypothetical protein